MNKISLKRKIFTAPLEEGLSAADDLDQSLSQLTALAEKLRAGQVVPENLRLLQSAETTLQKSGRWLLASDLIALLAAFLCGGLGAWATNIYFLGGSFQELFSFDTLNQLVTFAGLGAIALLWLDTRGHYRQRLPYWEAVFNILTVAAAGLVLGGFFQFAAKNNFSRLWLGLSWTLFAVFLFAGRALMRSWLESRGQWRIPALIVGQGPTARGAVRALSHERGMGFDILNQVAVEDLDKLARPRAWKRLMLSCGASYLFLALEGGDLERYQIALKAIARERLPYSIVPPWLGLPSSTLSAHHFMMHDVLLLHETNRLSLPVPRMIKRCFDIAGSSILLLLLSPLFAAVALMIKRDGGKVFYAQPRVGFGGKLFSCYKFRSMRSDADAALKDYLASNPDAAEEWQHFQKLKNDPRITSFGQFIRRTSIDELPQLFNVLKGEMSLVGPRPIMQGQESFYEDDFIYYESVRPGITGPWQVSGRNMLSIKQRVALEAWYARNWSPWVDIVILLKTIPALLEKNQAF